MEAALPHTIGSKNWYEVFCGIDLPTSILTGDCVAIATWQWIVWQQRKFSGPRGVVPHRREREVVCWGEHWEGL